MSNIASLNLNVEEESQNTQSFSPLPAGEYTCVITASELADNKSGTGSHLNVTLQVIEGEYADRMLWNNFNVQNSNPTAEKIGRAELAALCKAVGVMNPQSSEELHDKPFVARVILDRKDASRNAVKGYAAATTAAPAPAAPPKAAPSPAAKPAAGAKPWQRK